MNDALAKFQELLRELFQFDCADLDFGIYRIMNHKRDVIERFIIQDLPKSVKEELDRGAMAEQAQAARELEAAKKKALDALGDDALDAEGNLIEKYRDTKAGKEYLAARAKSAGAHGRETLEAGIYNHLYAFFSRYYQDGDFISKRRYSRRERYAIPYNGEEVYLYWANHDQYYIKTAEYFTDYAFTAPNGVSVHFKIKAADVEQNNVKGEKRFFLPRPAEAGWDENARRLVIPFEYRPLTEQETIAYGQKNQQEAISAKALEEIPKRLSPRTAGPALAALTAERRKASDGEPVTFFEHHLRQYTRRNTSDFFIHKDLKGFLGRELDFYLKNEVLNLDEMEASGENRAEGWFQMMHLIKAVGVRIIEFLHQVEEFQKMLWEKRKFITETQYCITVGCIAEEFYAEIAACEAQWDEWKALFHIDEEKSDLFTAGKSKKDKRIAFLKAHTTLVSDTKHFDRDFVDRLLGSFEDLDEMTDGLLVHSENWQALSLLEGRYREQVCCIYLDPPYNTGSDNDFAYKDNYQHSSWASMIFDRSVLAGLFAKECSGIFVSTDDGEYSNLRAVLGQAWGDDNFIADVIWNSRKSVSSDALISVAANHTTFLARNREALEQQKERFRLIQDEGGFQNPDNDPRGPWKLDPMDAPNIRENLTYPITNLETGETFYPPKGRFWRFERWQTDELLKEGRILFGRRGTAKPMYKRFLTEAKEKGKTPTTLWDDVKTTTDATKVLLELFGDDISREVINNLKPKPTELVERCAMLLTNGTGYVLDYFAGSGTTGHAVINLNREDGGRRNFILVEMADYFDTVLLPRIKKVTFTPEWKDGKPKRMATAEETERSPRIVKYIRLESYEDALNNIAFGENSGQQAIQFEDYLLQYMLKWETRRSETLLNIEKLARPFHYRLHIHADGQTREKLVDVPETFNYLLGLHVWTRRVYSDGEMCYLIVRGRIDHRSIAVIWRDTEGWQKADFERDKNFVAGKKLAEGADDVFVNGDSLIPGARALDPIFKARMFAPVEA